MYPNKDQNYVSMVARGEATFEDSVDVISAWHKSDDSRDLHEVLGLRVPEEMEVFCFHPRRAVDMAVARVRREVRPRGRMPMALSCSEEG